MLLAPVVVFERYELVAAGRPTGWRPRNTYFTGDCFADFLRFTGLISPASIKTCFA